MRIRLRLEATLQRAWMHRGALACLLWPVAWAYSSLVRLRRQLFRWGILKTQRVPAVVIVVGNVMAGGVGKTPSVISIVRHLQAQGRKVGVVSKGYGRQSKDCLEVQSETSVHACGDEPLLIHKATQAPVLVAPSRWVASTALLNRYPDTEIIVCDDGLQDYTLHRDIEICVFDDRACGNGWLLPAGPLRDHWPRPRMAMCGANAENLLLINTGNTPVTGQFQAQRSLGEGLKDIQGNTVAWSQLAQWQGLPLKALAGIARPAVFFQMLRENGVVLAQTQALPDHFHIAPDTLTALQPCQIICTEKDASKVWAHDPKALSSALTQTIEPAFFDALHQHIARTDPPRLSLHHGH